MTHKKNPPPYGLGQSQQKKKNTHAKNAPNGSCSLSKIIANDSLLATEYEKNATSKSLYGDSTARISSNLNNIHDRIRLRAYQSVLRCIKGKSLLHIGCGMGLISLMAARSLASVVVAIDNSAIVDAARVVAEQNGLQNISFFRGSLREMVEKFPVKKFDVILCEWMGTFLVNDPLLEDALFAQENLLAEGGVMCPDGSSIHIVGVSDYSFHLNTVEYWSNVYGFTMEPMKQLVRKEVETCAIPLSNIVTDTCLAHTVNIQRFRGADEKDSENGFVVPFKVRATCNTTVNYLTFFVDATFTNQHDPGANFVIGIRPGGGNAWTETSVGLLDPLPLNCGETLSGELRVRVLDRERGTTLVEVKAQTDGAVVAQKTTGSYVYQSF
ncbi:putative arginine N-methyltransferase [Trypanosoma rangeli]|uniref:Putative arginine N-methyltransferase n=1 Tax=Trypanosoma rangeli TaxID=5698 RepID=A0A3R7NHM3_TRYRA|nr:putative arginine N-methyltransferase [Trypanosoma rangeli]RNF06680.1 putative arginine N-methyltransferase [Trypanosoma rangeli]|eukprot:RNF06680.1 putative arginine N-methyltransferase [Trypanosoma rangeli]